MVTTMIAQGSSAWLAKQKELNAQYDYFEPKLAESGLSRSQIDAQDEEGLQAALSRINALLEHPEELGPLQLPTSFGATRAIEEIQDVPVPPAKEVDPEALLLRRKKYILRRIASLQPKEELATLRDQIESEVADPKVRQSLVHTVDLAQITAEERNSKLIEEIENTEAERQAVEWRQLAIERARAQIEQQKTDIEERKTFVKELKARILQSFFGREVVAGAIGGILLLVFGITVVIAMFTHTAIVPIVSDSFLLILGYFFGQATGRGKENPMAKNT